MDEEVIAPSSSPIPPGWQALPPEPMPHPTYFPAALALAVTFIFWGLITSPIILAIGIGLFIAAMAGWIHELRHERKQHQHHASSSSEPSGAP